MTRQGNRRNFSDPGYNSTGLQLELDIKDIANKDDLIAELKNFAHLGLNLHPMQTNPPPSTRRGDLEKLLKEAVNAKIAKAKGHQSIPAQPPAPAAHSTGVAPYTGGQPLQPNKVQSTSQANVEVWTIDKLYEFIAGEMKSGPKGPLSPVDMAKQHCFEKGIAHNKNELHAYWQSLAAKNATSMKCWLGGIILGFTPLIYMTLLFEIDHGENWSDEASAKDPVAKQQATTFVDYCWWTIVFCLLFASTCFLWRHPQKRLNAFGSVCIIVLTNLYLVYYHWCNVHISNHQAFRWSVPLVVVTGAFFFVVWCFN